MVISGRPGDGANISLQLSSPIMLPPVSVHSHGEPVVTARPFRKQHTSTWIHNGLAVGSEVGIGAGVTVGALVAGHRDKSPTPITSPPASRQAHGLEAGITRSSTLQQVKTCTQAAVSEHPTRSALRMTKMPVCFIFAVLGAWMGTLSLFSLWRLLEAAGRTIYIGLP